MGDERERLQPPATLATPAPRPDAKVPAPGKDDARRNGPGHDISSVGIHPPAPGATTRVLDRFALDSAALTEDHRKALEAIAADIASRLATTPGARAEILVAGHTDTSGDEARNQDLGLDRAEAAKAGLETALARQRGIAGRVDAIATESLGETRLAKRTPDNAKEPANRRVEVTVKISGPPPVVVAPGPGVLDDEKKKPKPPILDLPKDFAPREETWWERAERDRKAIEEFDRKHPRRTRSVTDVIADGVVEALEPLIRKLPGSLRDKARKAIRSGIESGTEKGCEAAVDASGLTGEAAEGAKAMCKASLKTKHGGER